MKTEAKAHLQMLVHGEGNAPTIQPANRHLFQTPIARGGAVGLLLISLCGVAAAQGNSPTQLRQFIDHQAGGLNKLNVPATNTEIPVPRQADGTVNPRYQTTEAKRYLGKLLFHDPIRAARVN